VSPAHGGQRRWLALALVVAVFVGLAIAARTPGTVPPGGPPVTSASTVGAPDAESSAWYCTGQTTAAGALAPGSVILTNTGTRSVSGVIHAVTDTGVTVETAVRVAARSEVVAHVPAPKTGTWLSEVVNLAGGGVAVSQALQGPSGWAEAPCLSTTAQQWYFPSGTTTGSNGLFIALFNPTSTPDVVDLSFATAKGPVHPINFQGLVLQPDQTQVESVSPYVQEQANVATTVLTRTGRLVASELQLVTGASAGLAIVPGSPGPDRSWAIPQAGELPGGASSIDIFNPGSTTQDVTVRTRVASGALFPFREQVAPDSTWVLSTSRQTRIPKGDPYSARIETSGGPGVVVGRTVIAPASAPAPQAGLTDAVDGLSSATRARQWVVPSPGTAAAPALVGAYPGHLGLTNLSDRSAGYKVQVMRPSGTRTIASGRLGPSQFVSLGGPVMSRAGLYPLIVSATGAMAVSEDVAPTGSYGVVSMPGIPLSPRLGS
jgi:hypothetical protein